MSTWTHVTWVESDSEPGVEYQIEQRPDGARRCSCRSFRFIRAPLGTPAKQCKHLKAHVLAQATSDAPSRCTMPKAKSMKSPLLVETFTFRRAISFGGGLTS